MGDPVRLRDPRSSATKELRELLAAGRSEIPAPQRLHGLADRLGYPPSAVPGSAKLLAKSGAAGAFAGATKIGALILVVGAGAAMLAMRGRTAVPASHVLVPAATTSTAEPAQPKIQSAEVAPAQEPAALTSSSTSIPRFGPRGASPGRPVVAASPAPAASDAPSGNRATASTAVLGAEAPATWGSSAPPTTAAPGQPGAPALGPVEEAQRELASNPSHALYLALRDQRVSGDLVEERDLVIIRALLRLGRLDEARDHAARFLRTFPASTHREEVAAPFGFDPGAQNP